MYTVTCQFLGEEESMTDYDRAVDVCYSMHNESGRYAEVRDQFGNVVIEYGDIMQDIADLVILSLIHI